MKLKREKKIISFVQVRAATKVPNLLEMSECRDLHVGTAVRPFASPTSSVQWTERHCRWLPVCAVAEVLLGGRSWAGKGSQRER